MATQNSRVVDPTGLYANFGAPFPDIPGEDILTSQSRYQNVSATVYATQPLELGTRVMTKDGRVFVYVKQNTASAVMGSVLQFSQAVGEDTVSSSTDLYKIETGGVDTTWVAGAFAGDYVTVDAGTNIGDTRRIVSNTATTLNLDRPLTVALAVADSDITIWRPYNMVKVPVEPANTSLSVVSGISVGAITLAQYGWMQVRGVCENVLFDNVAGVLYQQVVADDGVAGTATVVTANFTVEETIPFGFCMAVVVSDTGPVLLTGCVG